MIDGGVQPAEAARILDLFLALPITIADLGDLHARALDIANRYGLPGTYDAHYIAIAEAYGCELWTDDQTLLNTLGTRAPFVRAIADYPTS